MAWPKALQHSLDQAVFPRGNDGWHRALAPLALTGLPYLYTNAMDHDWRGRGLQIHHPQDATMALLPHSVFWQSICPSWGSLFELPPFDDPLRQLPPVGLTTRVHEPPS